MPFVRDRWPQKGTCFVLMPFGEQVLRNGESFDWDNFYQAVIHETIKKVGMTPLRADVIDGAIPILERLWTGIQEAEVIVADLTGRNPNVMYELGMAHVIGKKIIILTMDPDVPADFSSFVQIRYSIDGRGLIQLAQQLYRNLNTLRTQPSAENMILPLPGVGMEVVAAKVLSVTPDFATVEARDGRRGFLNVQDFSWTRRVKDLTRVLQVGKELHGAFVIDSRGQQKYSLTFSDNPWPKLEREFPVGSVFQGTVVNLMSERIGAFVNMNYGIHGLIPQSQIPRELITGMDVKVRVARIDSTNREISLEFVDLVPAEAGGRPAWGPFHRGQVLEGQVEIVAQDKGFILVHCLPNNKALRGILHISKMSPLLRDRFFNGDLQPGEPLTVEIIEVNALNQRVSFRDWRPENDSSSRPREMQAD